MSRWIYKVLQLKTRKRELDAFYKALKAAGPIVEFDEELWNMAVEEVTIQSATRIVFTLRNGEIV